MYNATEDFLEGFSMPKLRAGGQVAVLFTAFAFNEETGAAEGYMEFHDQIWSNNLIDRFEELGATSVDIMTFQHNDGNQSAASAYNRVRKVAANSGFILITSVRWPGHHGPYVKHCTFYSSVTALLVERLSPLTLDDRDYTNGTFCSSLV